MSGSLRIKAPSAAAAFVLVDLLDGYGATATPEAGGEWVIHVGLLGNRQNAVPASLGFVRQWLEMCGLPSTSVTLDSETYLLRGDAQDVGTVRAPAAKAHLRHGDTFGGCE
jgi:hypothetical protein